LRAGNLQTEWPRWQDVRVAGVRGGLVPACGCNLLLPHKPAIAASGASL
jgi:hypothetical protein